MMHKGNWSGSYSAPNGGNTYPYTVESEAKQDMHTVRENSVMEAEKESL